MRGRPVLGAVGGLFFGLFLAIDLVMFRVVGSDTPLLVVLPALFLVVGIAVGARAPLGRGR